MPQLDTTWFISQIFWLVATFVALYFVLSRFLLPPLQDIMARRGSTVAGDIEKAQGLKSEAEQARQEYERTLAEARGKAQQLMDDTMASHKSRAEKAAKEMDRQLETKLADSARKITAKKDELTEALTPTAAELTAMIVEKLTQHKPANEQVSRIISELSKGRR